jgi:hypothetical protein
VFLIDTLLNMQYEEDNLYPAPDMESLDDDNNTEMQYYNEQFGLDDNRSETITVDSQKNKYRKMWDDSKKADKGFHKIKRTIDNKKVEIEVYSTNYTPGLMIRDAITGDKYCQFRVGSVNEYQFFKVRILTGELGKDGVTLFFDSPEQYERHMKAEVSTANKEKWLRKCAEVRHLAYEQDDNISDYVVVK